MKRDMDLIRRIALAVADLPPDQMLKSLENVDAQKFALHTLWMHEAGLVVAGWHKSQSDLIPKDAFIIRLTWDGCEFADSVRNETLWAKAKETIIKPSLAFSFSVFTDWLKAEIAQGLPSIGK